jgi:pimeloyl-ACP methyl ester carboxylesterase
MALSLEQTSKLRSRRSLHPRRVGSIVTAALVAGLVTPLIFALGVAPNSQEPIVTGVALLAFAGSWAVIALCSTRWSDQPQSWAAIPGIVMAVAGIGLVIFAPTTHTLDLLSWVWPPVLVALVAWIAVHAHRQLHSRTRRWMLYPLCGALLLGALGGGYETARESLDRSAYPMPGQLIDVGGHRLHISCTGVGRPTVVLEAGFGNDSTIWAWIAPEVAHDTRVCVYDRAGQGWSEPAAGPQDGVAVANDLHTLLDRANEPGPYVLVGHSLGGAFVLNFAARYPNDVAGVVLLDSMHPEQYTRVPGYSTFYNGYRRVSALFPSLARLGVGRLINQFMFSSLPADAEAIAIANASTAKAVRSQHAEWSMIPTTLTEAQAMTTLGDRPLMVVTAERGMQDNWMPLQDELATLSSNSTHRVFPDATHASLVDDEAVAAQSSQAIRDLVTLVRQSP